MMTPSGQPDEVSTLEGRVDELQRVVDLLVHKMEDDFDCEMDYRPRSVAYLDAILAESQSNRRALTPSLFLSIGGYLGETLVRSYEGEWTAEGDNLAVELEGAGHTRTVQVFDWVKDAYADPHGHSLGQRLDRAVGDGLGPELND